MGFCGIVLLAAASLGMSWEIQHEFKKFGSKSDILRSQYFPTDLFVLLLLNTAGVGLIIGKMLHRMAAHVK